ncbi:MAG: hypothetical protein RX316_01230 [bacterium]|nr:hypothetical protein [bacterium]
MEEVVEAVGQVVPPLRDQWTLRRNQGPKPFAFSRRCVSHPTEAGKCSLEGLGHVSKEAGREPSGGLFVQEGA